jgi:hypothetical protein
MDEDDDREDEDQLEGAPIEPEIINDETKGKEEATKNDPVTETNWRWRRHLQRVIKLQGPSKQEILEIQQKEEAKERRRLERLKPAKQGAQFVLLNYELKTKKKVQFPTPLFGYGAEARGGQREEWRLMRVKMANHSHWVLTLFSRGKLIDIILHL